jgi:hypothetical protein
MNIIGVIDTIKVLVLRQYDEGAITALEAANKIAIMLDEYYNSPEYTVELADEANFNGHAV